MMIGIKLHIIKKKLHGIFESDYFVGSSPPPPQSLISPLVLYS